MGVPREVKEVKVPVTTVHITEEKEERVITVSSSKNVNGSANPNTLYTHLHTNLLLIVTKFATKSEVPREVKEVKVPVTTVHITVVKEEKEERVITVSSSKNVNGSKGGKGGKSGYYGGGSYYGYLE